MNGAPEICERATRPGVLGAEYFREIRELLAGGGLPDPKDGASDVETRVGAGESVGLEARPGRKRMAEERLVGLALARMSHSSR